MKKTSFSFILFLSTLFAFGQTDTLRTKGRKSIPTVIGKWQLDSINGSSKNGLMPCIIEFLENGDYNETVVNVSRSGKWKIENGMIIREEISNQIENLTMKKMVYSELKGKKKVFFYFSKMDYKAPRQDVIPH